MPTRCGGAGARAAEVGHVVSGRGRVAEQSEMRGRAEHVQLGGDSEHQRLGQVVRSLRMHVAVDEPGQQCSARPVDHLRAGWGREAGADLGDHAVDDENRIGGAHAGAVKDPDTVDQEVAGNREVLRCQHIEVSTGCQIGPLRPRRLGGFTVSNRPRRASATRTRPMDGCSQVRLRSERAHRSSSVKLST